MYRLVSLDIIMQMRIFVSRPRRKSFFFNGSVTQARGFKKIVSIVFVLLAKFGEFERYLQDMYTKPCGKAFRFSVREVWRARALLKEHVR